LLFDLLESETIAVVVEEELFDTMPIQQAIEHEIATQKVAEIDHVLTTGNKEEEKIIIVENIENAVLTFEDEEAAVPEEKEKISMEAETIPSNSTTNDIVVEESKILRSILNIEDEKTNKEIERNQTIEIEEAEEIEQVNNNKKNQIFVVVGKIKSIMVDFSIIEIKRVIEIILHYQDIIDQIITKKINLTKEIISEVLKNSVEDAVRKLRGFVDDKVFKIDFEADPTHRNTTTPCLAKGSNSDKENNFTKPYDDDSKKVILIFFLV